jgi:hypothetical protein
MTALRGGLISSTFANDALANLRGFQSVPRDVGRALQHWSEQRHETFGPASSPQAIADGVIVPLLRILGYTQFNRTEAPGAVRFDASSGAPCRIPVLVVGWGDDLQATRRTAVLSAISIDARWCLAANGLAIRVFDGQRTWNREYLELDFDVLGEDPDVQALCWSLLRADSLTAAAPLLEVAAARSAEYGDRVCRALGDGVLAAIAHLLRALAVRADDTCDSQQLFEQSLTIVYRVLFLLFAEARGLVPVWHPVYRDRYTIEAIVTSLLAGRHYRGIWSAIQAISRLAHAGCSAGELQVTAFNGRLFSPAYASAFDRRQLKDGIVAEAVLAVSTTQGRQGRTRIGYRDLDVEQLGAVYEHVLEYRPDDLQAAGLTRDRDVRQASGTFYTPRQVTSYLIRETLAPLVRDRTAEAILRIRILDPAMGSGAFLVAGCRFLARAAEDALIREGKWHPGDITPDDRALLRREIAQRCLFGVDLNPIAVQLARLSLWLTTLAADKPLTFLDHHLVAGNSLVGAAIQDIQRQPGGSRRNTGRPAPLPLFDEQDLVATLQTATRTRDELARLPDDSAAIVHEKERRLAAVHHRDGPLGRWRRVLDLWCAGWFGTSGDAHEPALFSDLVARLLHGKSSLPARTAGPLLESAAAVAERQSFLHWPLTFPEVFDGGEANTRASGFDAIVGNPPWDMVRGDSGGESTRSGRRDDARQLTGFVRGSGVYKVGYRSHLNRYVLFLERALQLARAGGRIGLVLPAGVMSDVGMAPVRRHLFDRAAIDGLTGLDNRAAIFPIHRSVRFVLLTGTTGQPTAAIACRFGISRPQQLDAPAGPSGTGAPIVLSRAFLARVSGNADLGVPDLAAREDLGILEKISAAVPCAGDEEGWALRFGRELNASDDRGSFAAATRHDTSRPVLEGKHLAPFRVALDRARYELRDGAPSRSPRRARLAYRDVAGATNRLTLIAAIVPARAATIHTLFCLKTPLPLDAQHVLCALLNSFVANYLVRLRVSTHVTTALMSRLRLPLVERGSSEFARLMELSRSLTAATDPPEKMPEYVELQALVARLYGLTSADFAHILNTFPLIPLDVRDAALAHFSGFH